MLNDKSRNPKVSCNWQQESSCSGFFKNSVVDKEVDDEQTVMRWIMAISQLSSDLIFYYFLLLTAPARLAILLLNELLPWYLAFAVSSVCSVLFPDISAASLLKRSSHFLIQFLVTSQFLESMFEYEEQYKTMFFKCSIHLSSCLCCLR